MRPLRPHRSPSAGPRAALARWALAVLLLGTVGAAAAVPLRFTVWLDDRPIGHHRFDIEGDTQQRQVTSEADFTVEWLHVPVFRYRHADRETWRDGCLQAIDASTRTNGRLEEVRGHHEAGRFLIEGRGALTPAPACVMTFAYWDKRILEQSALLNAQTGVYAPIKVASLGTERFDGGAGVQNAEHYRLTAGDLRIELWYGPDGRWLGLRAPTKEGRTMTYRADP